ncbi:hypothetical protein Bca52824_001614 [Brassica carinata]|uniref:Ubiquitin-like protease family profile domain-containing protein n=1 Tax=Brassica carinata TaxID=52824 RepID=A0A8X7WGL6_BRACI|nr:hypothetical protein Bca52824_001614 [Brassica carinata]
MVDLINVNHQFNTSHFVGGVSRSDVDLEKAKKPAPFPQSNDAGYIANLVIERLKPQLQNFENRIEHSSRSVELIEGKVIGIFECVLSNFKDEIVRPVESMVPELCKNYAEVRLVPAPTTVATGNGPSSTAHPNRPVVDTNANTIFNIIQNISEYSTPPSSPQNTQAGNKTPSIEAVAKPGFASPDPATDCGAMSAHSQNHSRHTHINIHLERIRSAEPSTRQEVANVTTLSDINIGDNIAYPQSSRKSKRQKMVPAALKSVFVCYEKREIERKINVLSDKLAGNIVINVGGLAVSSKEMLLMAEILRLFPAKVVDILIRLVRCVVSPPTSTESSYYFLDTRFGTSIVRNYQKDASPRLGIRYYFPLNVGKKHWIGVCFDTSRCKLSMGRYLSPFLQMLQYLARHFGEEMGVQRVMPYKFDRPKSVFQNANPADAGLIAVLLMLKHAVYGFEACRHLSAESVADEGKSAAIMDFESKEKL